MNLIVVVLLLAGLVFLIYLLVKSIERHADPETPQGGGPQRSEGELPRPTTETNPLLTQRPEPAPKPEEKLTASPRNAAGRSHCPACEALIMAYDERCPSCGIAFVADGLQGWTLGNAGPADGICRSPTDVSE
jgi:hypothetical protein